jgi:hypothetical protein
MSDLDANDSGSFLGQFLIAPVRFPREEHSLTNTEKGSGISCVMEVPRSMDALTLHRIHFAFTITGVVTGIPMEFQRASSFLRKFVFEFTG